MYRHFKCLDMWIFPIQNIIHLIWSSFTSIFLSLPLELPFVFSEPTLLPMSSVLHVYYFQRLSFYWWFDYCNISGSSISLKRFELRRPLLTDILIPNVPTLFYRPFTVLEFLFLFLESTKVFFCSMNPFFFFSPSVSGNIGVVPFSSITFS